MDTVIKIENHIVIKTSAKCHKPTDILDWLSLKNIAGFIWDKL